MRAPFNRIDDGATPVPRRVGSTGIRYTLHYRSVQSLDTHNPTRVSRLKRPKIPREQRCSVFFFFFFWGGGGAVRGGQAAPPPRPRWSSFPPPSKGSISLATPSTED